MSVFGIDLGTTNSCIAVLKNGKPEVLPADNPSGIVPSVVGLENGAFIVGTRARNRAGAFPEGTVSSVKRHMGTSDELTLDDGSQKTTCSPEEISAVILRYLAAEAKRLTGEEVKDVVITVPAYFSDGQRRATLDAGRQAGLNVLRLLNEPTAAALFYGQIEESTVSENLLVYDLGGGTFDVSVLRSGAISEVLASTGDTHLGGDDFDAKLVGLLLEGTGYSLEQIKSFPAAWVRLALAAEKARIRLSNETYVHVREADIQAPGGGRFSVDREIERSELEQLCQDLLSRTADFMHQAVSEASLERSSISKVLLVGGVTRMPAIKRVVQDVFGNAARPALDPDRAVACGAAIQGGIITGEQCDRILVDVTPHTLSVECLDSDMKSRHSDDDLDMFDFMFNRSEHLICAPIIPRNTQIPVTRAEQFWTVVPNQERCNLRVFQGESRKPAENTLLGEVDLILAKAPAGSPVIVEYTYTLDGIVRMRAEHKGYGRKVEISLDSRHPKGITADGSRTVVDVEAEPAKGKAEDKAEAAPEAAPVNFVTHRARQKLDSLPEGGARTELEALLSAYEKALASDADDVDDREDALMDKLDELDGAE